MFDKETLDALSKADAIRAAKDSVLVTRSDAPLALPSDFTLHDLEQYTLLRRRPRGAMTTAVLQNFVDYAKDHAEPGATVFVDADKMRAVAVLNLGTLERPGHADDIAALQLERTAAFKALLIADQSSPMSQQAFAEWLEDWEPHLTAFGVDGNSVPVRAAVAAVRRITIESAQKFESSEGQLSAERGVLESVKATSVEPIPVVVDFACEPYQGLQMRIFRARVSVLTGQPKPQLKLRIAKLEQHQQEMALELADDVEEAFAESAVQALPVYVGSYARR